MARRTKATKKQEPEAKTETLKQAADDLLEAAALLRLAGDVLTTHNIQRGGRVSGWAGQLVMDAKHVRGVILEQQKEGI